MQVRPGGYDPTLKGAFDTASATFRQQQNCLARVLREVRPSLDYGTQLTGKFGFRKQAWSKLSRFIAFLGRCGRFSLASGAKG
jgi:hypothetical protein